MAGCMEEDTGRGRQTEARRGRLPPSLHWPPGSRVGRCPAARLQGASRQILGRHWEFGMHILSASPRRLKRECGDKAHAGCVCCGSGMGNGKRALEISKRWGSHWRTSCLAYVDSRFWAAANPRPRQCRGPPSAHTHSVCSVRTGQTGPEQTFFPLGELVGLAALAALAALGCPRVILGARQPVAGGAHTRRHDTAQCWLSLLITSCQMHLVDVSISYLPRYLILLGCGCAAPSCPEPLFLRVRFGKLGSWPGQPESRRPCLAAPTPWTILVPKRNPESDPTTRISGLPLSLPLPPSLM
jgi:hypothetical protein